MNSSENTTIKKESCPNTPPPPADNETSFWSYFYMYSVVAVGLYVLYLAFDYRHGSGM